MKNKKINYWVYKTYKNFANVVKPEYLSEASIINNIKAGEERLVVHANGCYEERTALCINFAVRDANAGKKVLYLDDENSIEFICNMFKSCGLRSNENLLCRNFSVQRSDDEMCSKIIYDIVKNDVDVVIINNGNVHLSKMLMKYISKYIKVAFVCATFNIVGVMNNHHNCDDIIIIEEA